MALSKFNTLHRLKSRLPNGWSGVSTEDVMDLAPLESGVLTEEDVMDLASEEYKQPSKFVPEKFTSLKFEKILPPLIVFLLLFPKDPPTGLRKAFGQLLRREGVEVEEESKGFGSASK